MNAPLGRTPDLSVYIYQEEWADQNRHLRK